MVKKLINHKFGIKICINLRIIIIFLLCASMNLVYRNELISQVSIILLLCIRRWAMGWYADRFKRFIDSFMFPPRYTISSNDSFPRAIHGHTRHHILYTYGYRLILENIFIKIYFLFTFLHILSVDRK